ncbi:hypothetical protein GF385_03355 [Candidatus Dependentiae bacterium]|nr:hypothetical protein [Candidatus Dependentiae bacterium]
MKFFSKLFCRHKKFKNIKFLFKGSIIFSFLFFISLNALSPEEIVTLSRDNFKYISGFNIVLNSLFKNYSFKSTRRMRHSKKRMAKHKQYIKKIKYDLGKLFELETALTLKDHFKEDILGLNLEINISDYKNSPKAKVLLDGSRVELRTTEYDVVTKNFVVECKSGKINAKKINLYQFIKERNVIKWFKKIKEEIINGCLNYGIKLTKKGRAMLVLNGPSTLNKDICLLSCWLRDFDTNFNTEVFYDIWSRIIDIISSKELILIFKQKISEKVASVLKREGFNYKDNFGYENV